MVYANLNWFANYLDVQTLHSKGYKLWYANWQPKTTDFSAPVQIGKTGVYADIWQYAEGNMGAACRIIMCCGILKRWLMFTPVR